MLRCLTSLNPLLLLSDITLNLKDALFALAILIDIRFASSSIIGPSLDLWLINHRRWINPR